MRHVTLLRMPMTVLAAFLALAAWTGSASAGLVTNGSFEITTASTTTTFLYAGVSNWTNSDIGEALVQPSWFTNGYLFPPNVGLAGPFPQTSPDGGNFVLSDGDYHHSPILQTITGLNPGDSYQLSFYQALAQDTEPNVTVPGPVSGQWQVSLGSSTQLSTMMFANGATPTISPWQSQTMTFTAQNATEVLSFFSIGTGDPPMVALDGVDLIASTPEPGAISLMGLGALVFGWKFDARRRAEAARHGKAA